MTEIKNLISIKEQEYQKLKKEMDREIAKYSSIKMTGEEKEDQIKTKILKYLKMKDNIDRRVKELKIELRRIKTDEAWGRVVTKGERK